MCIPLFVPFTSILAFLTPFSTDTCIHTLFTHTHTLIDKMDAVGLFRKRRRLQSEEEGLSLTEYLRGKQEVDSGPAGKRVSISV